MEGREVSINVFGGRKAKVLRRDMVGWGEERDGKGTCESVTGFIGYWG